MWLKADRPGLQIMARAVLPRATDPQTGKPLTTLCAAPTTRKSASWQQLRLEGLPQLLERQVRVLRTQFGPQVDAREAYIDLIAGQRLRRARNDERLVDDLEVGGVVSAETPEGKRPPGCLGPTVDPLRRSRPADEAWPGGQGCRRVDLKGPLLLVGGKPFFPAHHRTSGRAARKVAGVGIQRRSLDSVSRAGAAQRGDGPGLVARSLRLRRVQQLEPGPAVEPAADRQFATTRCWSGTWAAVWPSASWKPPSAGPNARRSGRSAEPADRPAIPIPICAAYTRAVHVLLARRDPLGTTLPLEQYGSLAARPIADWRGRHAAVGHDANRPGPPGCSSKWACWHRRPARRWSIEEAQLRMLVHTALGGAGPRAVLYFELAAGRRRSSPRGGARRFWS